LVSGCDGLCNFNENWNVCLVSEIVAVVKQLLFLNVNTDDDSLSWNTSSNGWEREILIVKYMLISNLIHS
jgi:hypothetical protein